MGKRSLGWPGHIFYRSRALHFSAPFYRLRGVFLTKLGVDEAQTEEAFCRAIRTAKEQKSISWTKQRVRQGAVDSDYLFANCLAAAVCEIREDGGNQGVRKFCSKMLLSASIG